MLRASRHNKVGPAAPQKNIPPSEGRNPSFVQFLLCRPFYSQTRTSHLQAHPSTLTLSDGIVWHTNHKMLILPRKKSCRLHTMVKNKQMKTLRPPSTTQSSCLIWNETDGFPFAQSPWQREQRRPTGRLWSCYTPDESSIVSESQWALHRLGRRGAH